MGSCARLGFQLHSDTRILGRVHTDNFTRHAYRSRTVRVGLPVYTLRPQRRVRPVHSNHIRMCSQWTRTVRVGLALQCECSSGRVGRVGKGATHRLPMSAD